MVLRSSIAFMWLVVFVWFVVVCVSLSVQHVNHSRKRETFFMGSVYHKPPRTDDSIFVSIASYRDENCASTLQSIYENATHPNNVFVGIVQQNKLGDSECEIENKLLYKNGNVRTLRLSYDDAKGPCHARYLASGLYQGETYYFQVDSHMLFEKGWDADLVAMMRKLPTKSVVSHYPVSWDAMHESQGVPKFTHVTRLHDPILTFQSEYTEDTGPSFGASGGMIIMPGKAVREVYFDPNLDYVFQGEEMLYSARLYTHGFNFHSPTKNIVYHYYNREGDPKFWDKPGNNIKISESSKIISDRMKNPPPRYFGRVRTLDAYIKLLESKIRPT